MMQINKRILLTGATGLIGKELIEPLQSRGFEISAITIDETNLGNGVNWIKGSLFDRDFVTHTMDELRPTHLLNMAWATTGDYLINRINYDFLSAGIHLANRFAAVGGRRAVYAGTCFEYAFKDEPIRESDPLEAGRNEYTFCKNELRQIATRIFGSAGVSFGYGRIFYVYGRNEVKSRLTGMVIDKLSRGERVLIKAGPLLKDYIYAKDIAGAFAALVDCDVQGPVNICTGKAIAIRDYVMRIAERMGRTDLVDFVDDCAGQPAVVVGDATRLNEEVGYRMRYSMEQAINEIVNDEGRK